MSPKWFSMQKLHSSMHILLLLLLATSYWPKNGLSLKFSVTDPSFLAFQKTLAGYYRLQCDVIFLLDESTSIRVSNFRSEIKLTESIARLFRIGANDTRMAVATFSTSIRIHMDYIASIEGQLCNFLAGMKNIDNKGGWTFTKDALFTAKSLLKQGRQHSKKIIILIVDGRSNEANPISLAKDLHKDGFVIFVIGIGPYIDKYELKSIASSSFHLLLIDDFVSVPDVAYSFQKDIGSNFFVFVDGDHCQTDPSYRDGHCSENSICSCASDGNYLCACKKGYHSTNGFTNCTECPVGMYKDTIGWGTCIPCPEHSSTLKTGAETLSDCKCNSGFYGNPATTGTCKSKHCNKLSSPVGGDLIPANCGNGIGDECSYFCYSPYCPMNASDPNCVVKQAGRMQHTRTCTPSGEWTGEEFVCEKAQCQNLEPIFGGSYECDDETAVGSHCQLQCDSGRQLFGTESQRTCFTDGSWTSINATCTERRNCSHDFCENGGICYLSTDGFAMCSCSSGFTGMYCETALEKCNRAFCLNNGWCSDEFSCLCAPGYTGVYCETNVDDCVEGACINGGTCIDEINGFHCVCPHGVQGKSCEIIPRWCDSNPCQNGGRCLNMLQNYSCCCLSGSTGLHCEVSTDDCRRNPCHNQGLCMLDVTGLYSCLCLPGYDGAYCEEVQPCDSSLCENGGVCLGIAGNQSCQCLSGFTGDSCETELLTDFDLAFEDVSVSNHISFEYDVDLYAITISFWMRSFVANTEQRGTPISISYHSPITGADVANGLTWYDFQKFVIYLHGKPLTTGIKGTRDQEWHHYAFTWDSSSGNWAAYKDGVRVSSGSQVGKGVPIWKGTIVIGQEQDFVGGGFQALEAFHGVLSQVNIWDFAMNEEGIRSLGQSCGLHGNIFDWSRTPDFLHGTVKITDQSLLCTGLGFCRNSIQGCMCEQANKCFDVGSLCSAGECQNGGHCRRNSSACVCPPGYSGTHCQLDFNECLLDSGNCSHSCINTFGSYRCTCPSAFYLGDDDHTCSPIKYCLHQGVFHSDRQEWEEGCNLCRCIKGRVKCSYIRCSSPSACWQTELWGKLPNECCGRCLPANASCMVNKFFDFSTFDQYHYKFSGNCRYTLVKDCSDSSIDISLEIGSKNKFRKLIVAIGCSTVELLSLGQIVVDGTEIYPPYVENDLFNIYPTYKPYGTNGIQNGNNGFLSNSITIVTHQGVIILWRLKGMLRVNVPSQMQKRLCGLCGNYNGLRDDELATSHFLPARTFSEFILSWQVDNDEHCDNSLDGKIVGQPSLHFAGGSCTLANPKRKLALQYCEPLREAPFHPCYVFVNPKKYYELCMQDSCSCLENEDLCHCNAINAYALECQRFNVTVSISHWQRLANCVGHCQNGMIFSTCGPSCPSTCDPDFNDPRCQIQACRVGCHCPTNLILHNGSCIDPSECPNFNAPSTG